MSVTILPADSAPVLKHDFFVISSSGKLIRKKRCGFPISEYIGIGIINPRAIKLFKRKI